MDLRFQWEGAWRDTPAGMAHYLEHKLFDTPAAAPPSSWRGTGRWTTPSPPMLSRPITFSVPGTSTSVCGSCSPSSPSPGSPRRAWTRSGASSPRRSAMVDDDPDWQVYDRLLACLYRQSPVRLPVAGTVESIQAVTPQLLYDCHRAFYTPGNMVLVCVGGMELERVAELAHGAAALRRRRRPGAGLRPGGGPSSRLPGDGGGDGGLHAHVPGGLQVQPPGGGRGAAAEHHHRGSGLRRPLRGLQSPLRPPLPGGSRQRQPRRRL